MRTSSTLFSCFPMFLRVMWFVSVKAYFREWQCLQLDEKWQDHTRTITSQKIILDSLLTCPACIHLRRNNIWFERWQRACVWGSHQYSSLEESKPGFGASSWLLHKIPKTYVNLPHLFFSEEKKKSNTFLSSPHCVKSIVNWSYSPPSLLAILNQSLHKNIAMVTYSDSNNK